MENNNNSVKVIRLGDNPRNVYVTPGMTVGQVLEQAGIPTQGYALSLNGLGTSRDTELRGGEIITVVPKVEAGA